MSGRPELNLSFARCYAVSGFLGAWFFASPFGIQLDSNIAHAPSDAGGRPVSMKLSAAAQLR